MKVFKFGGASVRDSLAVKNLRKIVAGVEPESMVMVISAMGKSTNQLEKILNIRVTGGQYAEPLEKFRKAHVDICNELFPKDHHVYSNLEKLFSELEAHLTAASGSDKSYDKVVCYGELISTTIVHAYLTETELECSLLDARELIITDGTFREGKVRWDLTRKAIENKITANHGRRFLTQGFIAGDEFGNSVTLGREGSDFTAAIIASCIEADSVTIWKDVPGVMNADPDRWQDTIKYQVLSYGEAAEMTYYGASVIHPKTIRPLAVKKIPLIVRSFIDPSEEGTHILDIQHETLKPAVIFKDDQCLISFQVRDFTFINESKVSMIFHLFEEFNIRVNMMQSSAISFSVCVDSPDSNLKNIINSLSAEFDIFYNDHLELITVKNYEQELVSDILSNKQILLEQVTRKNYQALVSKED